ncbi:MAG: hypothetical protein QOH58_3391 [Thermoleophilaceae bacterium]|nr:hypothetical protein [Thermoleophilaceae bacterium]
MAESLRRSLLLDWVHLAVLWAFAFAKPLFDVLADAPEFFVVRGHPRGDILLFAVGLVLVPPTVLVLIEALAAPVAALRRALHLLFVAGLAGAFAMQVFHDVVAASAAVLLLLTTAASLAAAVAYAHTRVVPAMLTVLGPAPLVFVGIFLFASPVSKLVVPQAGTESARADVQSDAPVVMVIFDEFDVNMLMDRRERIDRSRLPNFAAFADDATWYRNATTVNSQTTMAVPAVLSGEMPSGDRLPTAADYPDSVFTLLGDSHELHVAETATQLCPESLCGERVREQLRHRMRSLAEDLGVVSMHLLLPEEVRRRLPAVDRTFGDFADGGRDEPAGTGAGGQPDVAAEAFRNRTSAFEALVRGIRPQRDRPALHLLHSVLPHVPGEYLPGGEQYLVSGPDYPGLQDEHWGPDPIAARVGLQRHLLQVGYVDTLLGRLVARLKSAGLYDRALIVLAADHGVSYRPGWPRRHPTPQNGSDIAGIPLLIKAPGQRRGRIDDSYARTVDVLPTIAELLGARVPWKVDGQALGDAARPPGRVKVAGGGASPGVDMPFDAFVDARRVAQRDMVAVFRSGQGGRGLYAAAPGADLLGRPVAPLAADAAPPARVALDGVEVFADNRPGALVPSYVTGRISGALESGQALAVAVNGHVRGVTASFEYRDELRLAAMVPADSFRRGANTVDVFAIEGAGAGRRLVPLDTGRPVAFRLVDEGGAESIEGTGVRIPVDDASVEGFVDEVQRNDRGLDVGGWAVDAERRAAVERVLVFEGTRFLGEGVPDRARPDIEARFDSAGVAHSGFRVKVSAAGLDPAEVRVFAISAGAAAELPRYQP